MENKIEQIPIEINKDKSPMVAGEKELRQVFEESTTKNVKAGIDYANDTRMVVRELEAKVKMMENQIQEQNKRLDEYRNQLSFIQQKLYAGGS